MRRSKRVGRNPSTGMLINSSSQKVEQEKVFPRKMNKRTGRNPYTAKQ